MDLPAVARHRMPYGQAFPLPELVYIRDWAAQRGLVLTVLLDQVLDGAEFEELLLIRGHGPSRRALTIWRTAGSVIAQAAGAQPRAFTCVEPALAHYLGLLEPAPPRRVLSLPQWLTRSWHRLALVAERHGVHV
jgi:hypothetical protein